jgi:NAD(P)H-hydrate repair Nnr-like enzyme with NAD(P)H-hydrate dehydratase domain
MKPAEALDAAWMRDHSLPVPGDEGKHARGQVLVVGGEIELAGAAMLAGVAALRAGRESCRWPSMKRPSRLSVSLCPKRGFSPSRLVAEAPLLPNWLYDTRPNATPF